MAEPSTSSKQALGHHVSANGLTIYYEEYGSGQPLILVHGGTLTCRSWDTHLPTFAKHFHVYALDSRGHGKTNNPTAHFSYAAMADDVAAFMQALHIDKPLLLGFSDGGQIALDFGIRYPERVRALIIVAAASRVTESTLRWIYDLGFEGPHQVNIARMEREHPDLVNFWKEQHTLHGPETWRTFVDQISVLWYTPLAYSDDDLRSATAPTLIALGDRDGVIPIEEAVHMYRLMPNAELVVTPNAEHFFPDVEHPYFRQMFDFLLRYSEQG